MTTPDIILLDGSRDESPWSIGGKAWSLNHMRSLGIRVPPAFVITTSVCVEYFAAGRQLPERVTRGLPGALAYLAGETGRAFGVADRPLLVSVRSGAPQSMPGMMDTLLNVGMSDAIEQAIADSTGDPAHSADIRRRFTRQYREIVGRDAPAEPIDQLTGAIHAVFDSWESERAVSYRRDRHLDDRMGTAVVVQAMVFGNFDDRSGTGVLFTRDPLTGSRKMFGEWLPRGQGEDVVSGRHDAARLADLAHAMPDVHRELCAIGDTLEQSNRDLMDIEFTVQSGILWLLQSRVGKRSPLASIRTAVEMCREGLITRREALERVTAEQLNRLTRPQVDPVARSAAVLLASGRPASPGLAGGVVVNDSSAAEERAATGAPVVLARPTTDPDDVAAMAVCAAVITELGGATSHAAVVCRELGVPCVVGCGEGRLAGLSGRQVTVDGDAGEVLAGLLPVSKMAEGADQYLTALADWARAEYGTNEPSLADAIGRRGQRPS
jgi:pyruvate,orthophosphate dikinase